VVGWASAPDVPVEGVVAGVELSLGESVGVLGAVVVGSVCVFGVAGTVLVGVRDATCLVVAGWRLTTL
jgi:hypothetical protein